jgi:hypothetical protein
LKLRGRISQDLQDFFGITELPLSILINLVNLYVTTLTIVGG